MMARILLVGAGSPLLAAKLAEVLANANAGVAEIKACEALGEGPHPADANAEAKVSTRGHAIGDRVHYVPDHAPSQLGEVIDVLNGHAVVRFDDEPTKAYVCVGEVMDDLGKVETEQQDGEEAAPTEVLSRDARYDPLDAAASMHKDVVQGEVVAVALVGITSGGAVRLYGSESMGQTLNLLAQGIQVADGTIEADDE